MLNSLCHQLEMYYRCWCLFLTCMLCLCTWLFVMWRQAVNNIPLNFTINCVLFRSPHGVGTRIARPIFYTGSGNGRQVRNVTPKWKATTDYRDRLFLDQLNFFFLFMLSSGVLFSRVTCKSKCFWPVGRAWEKRAKLSSDQIVFLLFQYSVSVVSVGDAKKGSCHLREREM